MSHKANDLHLEDLQERVESAEDQEQAHLTLGDLPRLKEAYNEARTQGKESFTLAVEGGERQILTAYARYLIEYMDYVSKIRGVANER